MSDQLPPCPECASEFAYESGALLACPMCGHEWAVEQVQEEVVQAEPEFKDAHGTVLVDGDDVLVIKDLKVKGAGGTIKVGTKVRGIRLFTGGSDGHDIDAKVPGFGQMELKTSVVKKA